MACELKQPNGWSCLPTCLAMLTDIPYSKIIEIIGHDGSEIIYPTYKEPECRKAFELEEIKDAAFSLGFSLLEITLREGDDARLDKYLLHPCIVCGSWASMRYHAVAWFGDRGFDPWSGPLTEITGCRLDRILIVNKIKT